MTKIITTVSEWQHIATHIAGKTIGFVPTMGCLHDGHRSLLKKSKQENEIAVMSIFVNKAQFSNDQDYQLYPKSLDHDKTIAEQEKIDYIFCPEYHEIYHDNYTIKIRDDTDIGQIMEGHYRPDHFDGMLTIVMKLFNIINPHTAYFGEKDYQQLLLVRQLVKSFFMKINIISCPTIRLRNGLPMSSRNKRLSEKELDKAALFSRLLSSKLTNDEIINKLVEGNIHIEYIYDIWNRKFGAITINDVRLIDNCELSK